MKKVWAPDDLLPMLRNQLTSSWLVRPVQKTSPALRLFCLPFAGVGASAYRGWAQDLQTGTELVLVHPPGRETRLRECDIPMF